LVEVNKETYNLSDPKGKSKVVQLEDGGGGVGDTQTRETGSSDPLIIIGPKP